ncbi:cell division cycle protein 27 homolog [Octopus bimaculoides]|uniref:cell division cycle protein 27 homolog n=1 Tax=Octopus bimaculoides TaxID=37653 RepID=UPI0022E74192|nr:cell division cycle protein 27 homolog [Octopus bimaculoides]
MLIQEPVQAAIWDALNNYAVTDATFLAERLFSEVANDESLYLLATCYYRAGKPVQSYLLLQSRGCHTAQCKYLLAKCCFDTDRLSEAEELLVGNAVSKSKTFEEIEVEYGPVACHVFSLLGNLYSKTERFSHASECYQKSLKLNPLLWSSFAKLCSLGEKVDVTKIFQPPKVPFPQSTPIHSTNPFYQPPDGKLKLMQLHQSPHIIPSSQDSITPVSDCTPAGICKFESPLPADKLMTPDALSPPSSTDSSFHQGIQSLRASRGQYLSSGNRLNFSSLSPLTPRPVTRRSQNQNLHPSIPKPTVFSQSGNTNTRELATSNQQSGLQTNVTNVRRSQRLFGNSSSVKENNKSQSKSRFTSPKSGTRKSKSKLSKSQQEMNEINKGENILDCKQSCGYDGPNYSQLAHMRQQSLAGILKLLQSMGRAFQALTQYECKRAIELLSELPQHQYQTGWVLCQVARAYFELNNYIQAEKVFAELRELEPYHMEGMDLYSTALWQLQREVELSALAQELTEMNKNAPEVFLQKEHDTAIKFFQRAIQVDPNFAYAYTLLGHEYVFTEEFEKGLSSFRNSIRVDSRHYNAWYGVGMIYYKQEKFQLAELHFNKALMINPKSPALLCHVGVVQHALKKSEMALQTLDRAISIDPNNPLCKFHRASILFANDKHKEALEELEELKQIVPKESLVYFLIGKVHKKLGNTHLALSNFSWAMDLDPKGINNQIKEGIDKRYVTDDDDSLVKMNDPVGVDDNGGEADSQEAASRSNSSNISNIDHEDLQLQAMESDESL